jgi:hypothetical protein
MPEFLMKTASLANEVQNSVVSRKSDVDSFWDSQGPVLEHYQERERTVNSAHYSGGSGEVVQAWLVTQPKTFFVKLQKLVSH